jgi:hypothetical protein
LHPSRGFSFKHSGGSVIQNYDFHLALLSLSARNAVQNRLTLDVYSSF